MNKESTTSVYFFKVYLQVVVTRAFSPSTRESRGGQTCEFKASWLQSEFQEARDTRETKNKNKQKRNKRTHEVYGWGLERRFRTRESPSALQRTKVWFPASHRAPQLQLLRI